MEKLKSVIETYGRWSPILVYIDRIETYASSDFSLALENAKALLESIGKEICDLKGIEITNATNFDAVLKKAFASIGHSGASMVAQVSRSLANIGQQMGELRNEIGIASHGRSLEEITARNNKVDALTRELLIETTIIVASFLIRTFEAENPSAGVLLKSGEIFERDQRFDDHWDETYGDFEMGEYSYPASEVFFSVDPKAYASEQKAFVDFMDG